MFPNQQNPSGNGYPPQYPQGGQPQQPQYGSHEVLPPLTNTGASGHNPYEFIMNPASKKRGLGFGGGGGAGKKFVIIACVAVLVIVLIAATLMSALAPKGSTPALISIAQHQQEIIRIADDASDKVSTQNAANFVINAELTVTTSQTEVLTYLRSHSGKKLNSKTLSLTKKPTDRHITGKRHICQHLRHGSRARTDK